ncbi:MAG TPA: hypothetical protein VGY91_00175, partial [Chthoniobacterales bacterium]|nr:hypothetical protein [Chthoniobacterales bacterium]
MASRILAQERLNGERTAWPALSPKISRAKALVRFSRFRAAQEAAPEEYWIFNRTMPHPEISIQHDPVHTIVAAGQEFRITITQRVGHVSELNTCSGAAA